MLFVDYLMLKKLLPRLFSPNAPVTLVVVRDAFSPQAVEQYPCSDLEKQLKHVFKSGLPANTRFYHNCLTSEHDVTPHTPDEVEKLKALRGRIYCVTYPADPVTIAITVAISVAVSVAVALLMPMPSLANTKAGTAPPSPNNSLAQRTNRQRLGGRIPDIFGQVWAYPDLIAPTYSVYVDHQEIEFSYMCLGRGEYEIHAVKDGETDINQVAGATVHVYAANQSLHNDTPAVSFGNTWTADEGALSHLLCKRYSSVNGQVLPPPDNYLQSSDLRVVFIPPNIVKIVSGDKISFKGNFAVGNTINIAAASDLSSANSLTEDADNDPATTNTPVKYNLEGKYTVASVDDNTLTLTNPSAINPDWQKLANNNDQTLQASPTFSTHAENLWQGWFYTDDEQATGIIINLIAPNGIYTVHPDNDKYAPFDVDFEVEIEQLDKDGNPVSGTLIKRSDEILGRLGKQLYNTETKKYGWSNSDEVRRTAAQTYIFTTQGKSRFRIRRTRQQEEFGKQFVSQEVKIKDFYSFKTLYDDDVGKHPEATTIYTKTLATEGALSLKERKLAVLCTRKVRGWEYASLKASKRADDIIYHLATDPKIGNITIKQVDMPQIKQTIDSIDAYFKDTKHSEFSHTFDSNDLSAEETIATVAHAVFSTAYRYNNKIRLHFERPEQASVAIFNSYNILPDSFSKSESFGVNKGYDGIQVSYTDAKDDAVASLYYPSRAVLNPAKHELVGVRNKAQAYTHMRRLWHKQQFAYRTVEFTAADESNIVIPTQRITVADQLRADVQQGQVLSFDSDSKIISLSDPVTLTDGKNYTLFLQLASGTVDNIPVTAGNSPYQLILSRLPSDVLSVSEDGNVVSAGYQLVSNDDSHLSHYIVTAKEPAQGISNTLTAINYDPRYYDVDADNPYTPKPVEPPNGSYITATVKALEAWRYADTEAAFVPKHEKIQLTYLDVVYNAEYHGRDYMGRINDGTVKAANTLETVDVITFDFSKNPKGEFPWYTRLRTINYLCARLTTETTCIELSGFIPTPEEHTKKDDTVFIVEMLNSPVIQLPMALWQNYMVGEYAAWRGRQTKYNLFNIESFAIPSRISVNRWSPTENKYITKIEQATFTDSNGKKKTYRQVPTYGKMRYPRPYHSTFGTYAYAKKSVFTRFKPDPNKPSEDEIFAVLYIENVTNIYDKANDVYVAHAMLGGETVKIRSDERIRIWQQFVTDKTIDGRPYFEFIVAHYPKTGHKNNATELSPIVKSYKNKYMGDINLADTFIRATSYLTELSQPLYSANSPFVPSKTQHIGGAAPFTELDFYHSKLPSIPHGFKINVIKGAKVWLPS